MQIALSVQGLSKKFGDFTAVNSVSFDVEDGKFFSILGPSGCGKTTLLRMIAGFYEPSGGSIFIQNRDMRGIEPHKRPVNLVFQQLALFPMMNVFENIAFGLKRQGYRGSAVTSRVNAMLERVGLPDYGKQKVTQLSGGQKQRVAIARALVLEPEVLLLDEPLGALDAKLREHMKVELKKLQVKVGTTFVYITHDQSEAMVMSDTVAVMKNGHFEQLDSPQNLYHKPLTSFVTQFVGENNKFPLALEKSEEGTWFGSDGKLQRYIISDNGALEEGALFDMFIRPEAVMINPEKKANHLNVLNVTVKAILFDGGNSRLLVSPEHSSQEIIVSLPQNRQYDYIRAHDSITIGWDPKAAVCFPQGEEEIYHDEI